MLRLSRNRWPLFLFWEMEELVGKLRSINFLVMT